MKSDQSLVLFRAFMAGCTYLVLHALVSCQELILSFVSKGVVDDSHDWGLSSGGPSECTITRHSDDGSLPLADLLMDVQVMVGPLSTISLRQY